MTQKHRSNRSGGHSAFWPSLKEPTKTVEQQRAEWKHTAEQYITRRFKSDPPALMQWGPDGFMLRDHRGQRSAKVTWGEAHRNCYPEWKAKKSSTKGAGIPSVGERTAPAKKKQGRRSKAKAKKQKNKRRKKS